MAGNNPPDFAAFIQAMIDAANAAAANQQPPPAPVPPAFALVPGMVNNDPLDFNKASDVKLFNREIQGIEPKFDLKEGNLHVFLTKLKEHIRINNWQRIVYHSGRRRY
jgi:hypothetical protein